MDKNKTSSALPHKDKEARLNTVSLVFQKFLVFFEVLFKFKLFYPEGDELGHPGS